MAIVEKSTKERKAILNKLLPHLDRTLEEKDPALIAWPKRKRKKINQK